jgi:phosphoesterase RecJ-like protein
VVRGQPEKGQADRKVSLRSTDRRVDVSAIARKHGGGGHRRAAGFSTDLGYDEVVEFLREEIRAQL